MSILGLEEGETPESIIEIKNLITLGKLDKAAQLIKISKENLDLGDHEKVLFQLLECDILYQRGLYDKLYTFAERIYKERLELGDNLIAVDMLNLMADCLLFLDKETKAFDIIKQNEKILKILTRDSLKGTLQREAYLAYVKGRLYSIKADPEKSLKYFEQSIILGENLSNKLILILSLTRISFLNAFRKGELKKALVYAKEALILANKTNHKFAIAYLYNHMGNLYSIKGKIDKSICFFNRSLAIFKGLNNVFFTAVINNGLGEAYRNKGNLKLALKCLEKCLVINHDLGLVLAYANNHDFLIQILVDIGDFQKAEQYLHQFKALNFQLKNKMLNLAYLFDKALILKGNPSHVKRTEAKEIFKQLIRKNNFSFEFLIKSLLNLCELLMDELHDTNNVKLLSEIPLYIDQIMNIAKKRNLHSLLAETYLLNANFDSFTLNLDRAKSNLIKAQNVAERHGITPIVQRVSIQRGKILHQTKEWQKLKDVNKVIMEFASFTSLKEQIRYMIKKRSILKDFDKN